MTLLLKFSKFSMALTKRAMITANLQLVGTAAVGPRQAEIGCAANRHLIVTAAVRLESTKAESAEIVKSHLGGKAAVPEEAL